MVVNDIEMFLKNKKANSVNMLLCDVEIFQKMKNKD